MSSTNYPGPRAWLETAAKQVDHRPGDIGRAGDIEPFGLFSDLVGQACSHKDPAAGAAILEEARARIAPLEIAGRAAVAILAEVGERFAAEPVKAKAAAKK